MKFNPYDPWTVHEARAIAADSVETLRSPTVYYHNAEPRAFKLKGGDAMLIIFGHGVPVGYGVLDAAGLQALRVDVRNLLLAGIDYSLRLYGGLQLCCYTSHETE